MRAGVHIRKLESSLVTLEYSLADFKNSTALIRGNPEIRQLDDLISTLEEANRELIAALANFGHEGPTEAVIFDS